MKKPNFFIIGGSRCGTTALSEYLREHPRIFMSLPKEPGYFAAHLPYPRFRFARNDDEYMNLFKRATDDHIAVGEASAIYMYYPEAIRAIRAFNPDAKLVAMVRNPVDMVYSWHSLLQYWFEEDEPDFRKAWELQDVRAKGEHVPEKCRDYRVLLYRDVGKFGEQMEAVCSIWPREQVRCYLLDDFAEDTKGLYEDILSFLGVPSDGRTEFPRINENKQHRNQSLARFVAQPPEIWLKTSMLLKKTTGIEHFGILEALMLRTARKATRPKLDPAFRAELIEVFRDDIHKLSRLLDRDLSHWLEDRTLNVTQGATT